jgi:hypothetical protein
VSLSQTQIRRTPTRGERQPVRQPPGTGRERVTLSRFWPDAIPFLCLIAVVGIIVYLVSWN